MLTCTDVTVNADGRPIVDQVSLNVPSGSCCVVMGASGAGKSTLLRAVAGLIEHSGSISVNGQDLEQRAPHRRDVGLLFQNARLFPTMSALDNVAYPLRIRKLNRRSRRATASALLEEVGLGDRLTARPDQLSGGERQRVALARALCSEPKVLMLDEPLTGLDAPQRRSLVRLLTRLQRDLNLTWVVVSHDPDDAVSLADTIAVLDHGRLVQHDEVEVVRHRPSSPLVASLLSNPNLLTGSVSGGRLSVDGNGVDSANPGGSTLATIRPEHLTIDERGTLQMTVLGIERRASHTVALVGSRAGTLEVHCGQNIPEVGSAVSVHFDDQHLWQLPPQDAPVGNSAKTASTGSS